MSAALDYMELMRNMVETAPEEEYREVDWIKSQRAAINHIAAIVGETPMFKECQEEYQGFMRFVDAIDDPERRLKTVWYHILERTVSAPTSAHVRGVVVMCIPALKYALDGLMEFQGATK